jgi:2-haloacid dehalogenase
MTPQAIIFDVGNVLLRWDPRLVWRDVLPDDATIEAFMAEIDFPVWNHAQDAGRDWDAAVAELSALHPHRADLIAMFHRDWHRSLPGEVPGTRAILQRLGAAGVPLYAITNFSAGKWEETTARFPFLCNSFRDIVVSAHEGVAKPDPEIYRRCLARNALDAGRCVFIDDSAENVAAAGALGLDAVRFTGAEALAAALRDRGCLP